MTVTANPDNPTSPTRVLRREGRSFHWAALFLRRRDAQDAARLYAFCRMVDDLADGTASETADAALAGIERDMAAGHSGDSTVQAFLHMAARRDLPLAAASGLIQGVRGDLSAPMLADTAELTRYSYRVAGTVGLMMCPLLGVHDRRAFPFAIDLGIAMQLTNIARDVQEDARRERRYLPASLLGAAIPPRRLVNPEPAAAQAVYTGIQRLLDLADLYYRSADRGMVFIPPRARLAIITARRVYAGIGERIRALGPTGYWQGRVTVSRAGKARRTGQAAAQFARTATRLDLQPPCHDPSLHTAIADLPGANPLAARPDETF